MTATTKKAILFAIAIVMLFGVSRVQIVLNKDRDKLGLTRVQHLENAPPVLAFTTVALGGFRGLISNALWMRASDLQDEDKFFEMAQLADWITKLEPHYVQVWLVQAWNMAYNISVKFKDYPDRWRWVKKGIELLRDDGLRYNPNEMLIYRELGWFFQHKLGQNLDDASHYYKQQWADEMAVVFNSTKPNLDEFIHPTTADQTNRLKLLVEKYKMDPKLMKEVNERYGPMEWRLPEAHAIYWGYKGLLAAQSNPTKIKEDDLITLRRVIYQSMQLSFQRGRLVENKFSQAFDFGPNLDIIPKVSAAYEQAAEEDKENHDHILRAHRNFLRDAIYFLYENNRMKDADYWFHYLCAKYPDKTLLDNQPKSLCGTVSLDQYAVSRVQEEVGDSPGGKDRVQAVIEGLLQSAYSQLILDDDDRYQGFKMLARQDWLSYQSRMPEERLIAIGLRPLADIDRTVLNRMLDPEKGVPAEARARLLTKLNLPSDTKFLPGSEATTNALPEKAASP